VDRTAAGTHLRGVTRIDADYPAPIGLRLVSQEEPEPGEAPGMQAAARFPASLLRARPDVRQILHDDHGAGLNGIDDTPAQNVVAVAPEAVDLPGQFAEVPLGRAGAFALETATQPEVPVFDPLPTPFPKEAVVGADGWARKAHVHSHDRSGGTELDIRKCHYDMEPEPPFAADQVRAVEADSLIQHPLGVGIHGKGNLNPARYCGESDKALSRLQCVGAGVIADRPQGGAGTGSLATLLLAGNHGFQRFRRLHPGRNHQLCWKMGESLSEDAVGGVVQPGTVLLPLRPAISRDGVEAFSVLTKRLQEHVRLLRRWIQPKPDRSLHVHMLPQFAKGGKAALLPRAEARGLRAAVDR